ncbi:MAG TPA: hypothetical protein VFN02_12080, partial [Ktedonobacteraceae bacterium]|nr:hypothetical protein [Ktedonobacteraceae bacterium]
VNKVTPVVALGERGARIVGAVLLTLIAITLLLDAILQVFPWYSAIAALTVILVFSALRQANGDLKGYIKLMATNLQANLLAALLILVALLVRGFAHI